MVKKIGFSFLGIIFLLFAYFQWNDPDSLKWILYYLMISGMCFASAFGTNKKVYILMMIAVSVIWLLTLLPGAIEWVNDGMPTIVDSMKASSPYIELVREFLGLLISLVVLGLLFIAERVKTPLENLLSSK